jgi:hypothetical protein
MSKPVKKITDRLDNVIASLPILALIVLWLGEEMLRQDSQKLWKIFRKIFDDKQIQ